MEACKLAQARSFLRFLDHPEGVAWVITDRRRATALARLIGRKEWQNESKGRTLENSLGKQPIGVIEAMQFDACALIEGGPDMLAAFELIIQAGAQEKVSVICMASTRSQFSPLDLKRLRGKSVRLFPHADKEGIAAAVRWIGQLEGVCAHIDVVDLRGIAKDLNDLTSLDDERWKKVMVFGEKGVVDESASI